MAKITFAIVVGNDVAGTVSFQEGFSPTSDRILAAYQSDPRIIQVTDESVAFGWTFDGTNFNPPQE